MDHLKLLFEKLMAGPLYPIQTYLGYCVTPQTKQLLFVVDNAGSGDAPHFQPCF
jgi:hypothetical protein